MCFLGASSIICIWHYTMRSICMWHYKSVTLQVKSRSPIKVGLRVCACSLAIWLLHVQYTHMGAKQAEKYCIYIVYNKHHLRATLHSPQAMVVLATVIVVVAVIGVAVVIVVLVVLDPVLHDAVYIRMMRCLYSSVVRALCAASLPKWVPSPHLASRTERHHHAVEYPKVSQSLMI